MVVINPVSTVPMCLVGRRRQRGHDAALLSNTFSKAVFLGNGLIAILAGLLANFLVDDMAFGPVAPFDASAVVLLIGGIVIHLTWTENYGDASDSQSLAQSFQKATQAIVSGIVHSPNYTTLPSFVWTSCKKTRAVLAKSLGVKTVLKGPRANYTMVLN
jgi:hypothetical protein